MHTHNQSHSVWYVDSFFGVTTIIYSQNDHTYTPSPACSLHTDVAADMDSEDIGLHLKILSLLENPAVIVAAAAAGDANTLKEFLRKHPTEVCSHLYML